MIHRRDLLNSVVTVSAAAALVCDTPRSSESAAGDAGIVDTNIHLFQWPFRRLPLDGLEAMLKKLRRLGIRQAWAASFEAVLHRDITAVNERLVAACRPHAELSPIGAVNLDLPDWEHDLNQCFQKHDLRGVRLYPNYHGYTLADPRFVSLLKRAAAAQRIVQIAGSLEDTRTQHPMVRVADVDLTPLPDILPGIDGAVVQILNGRLRGDLLQRLAETPGVYFDTARVEGTDSVAALIRSVPPGRVLFGSHAPFLIPEAALLRTMESQLTDEQLRWVLSEGSRNL
jgi:predicted TIM-barrel fold metal-dependent hydrolase